MPKPQPNQISVFAQVSPNKKLIDQRLGKNFSKFGRIGDVARQYGIECKEMPNGTVFTALKQRMQMFVEKLHFAAIPYKEM